MNHRTGNLAIACAVVGLALPIYLLRLDSGKVVRVTQPNTYRHAEDRITWDERVYLTWHPESPVVVTK